jgi:AraC family transcriptional regulator
MKQIPHSRGDNSYGVCWNTQEDCGFDYLCGVEVDAVDGSHSDLTTLNLPAGRYAVFVHQGHVSTLPAAVDAIWTKWAPDCGLRIRKAPFVECYTPEFDGRLGTGGMELWVPIEHS